MRVTVRAAASAAAITVALSVLAGWLWIGRWLDAPMAIPGTGFVLEVPKGQPFSATASDLSRRGVLDHPRLLATYARVSGADARVRAGEYAVPPATSPRALLSLLESGAVIRRAVTIVEGWTFRDLRRALAKAEMLAQETAGLGEEAVMQALGEPGTSPEGLFFPDTYLYDKDTSDLAILRQARARMKSELESAWAARAADLPVDTAYAALTLASIVEKETALPAERARIAGVFTERLRRGMRLQTDPTVIYGLGPAFDGNLRKSDLERDGPYNTYTRAGLPPTPIALPGAAALAAAVRPDERGELYFVATGRPDGSHEFSRTLEEHDQAVGRYLKRYRAQKAGQ